MTLPAPQANDPISADVISAENNAARFTTADNPNPDYGNPSVVPDAPSNDNVNQDAPAEPVLSKREQIAADHKARRAAAEAEAGDVEQNEMGEYVPPFVARQEDEARAAKEAEEAATKAKEAESTEPKPYTLKVRGNDVPVRDRSELAKLAEVEDDEADDFTDAQLIKLAQKQLAANAILDEAKAAKKSARTSAQDEGHTHPDSNHDEEDPDLSEANDNRPAPHQSQAEKHRALIEKIQFGEAEEAAAAFSEAVSEGVKEVVAEQQYGRRVNNVTNIIKKATQEFEAANADLIRDPDYAELVYNKQFVVELKKDLIANGLPPENVDRVIGNDIRTAMNAYVTIAADGRVKVRAPNQMFAAAAQNVRQKFNRPAPQAANTNTPPARSTPQQPAIQRRMEAKRALTPQPNRASVPRAVAAPAAGQTPAARSGVVFQMRKARGQA